MNEHLYVLTTVIKSKVPIKPGLDLCSPISDLVWNRLAISGKTAEVTTQIAEVPKQPWEVQT